MREELRVAFVGDSFVEGYGDPTGLGWVGRLSERARADGLALAAINLGVRGDTSADVLARWYRQCAAAAPDVVVFAFGANDLLRFAGPVARRSERTIEHLAMMLARCSDVGWQAVVVGPPPLTLLDVAALGDRLRRFCADAGTPFVDAHDALADCPIWTSEVARGDGAHPGAAGYAAYADVIWPLLWPVLLAGSSGG